MTMADQDVEWGDWSLVGWGREELPGAPVPTKDEEQRWTVVARSLMREFGLNGWGFGIRPVSMPPLYPGCPPDPLYGIALHEPKLILLDPLHVVYDEDGEIEKTIRHEIAHALLPAGAGHGSEWVEMAKRCGIPNPAACEDLPSSKMFNEFLGFHG